MNIYYNVIISLLCFIVVFALHKYDIWWFKNKLKREQLSNFDKTVRPIQNLGLKIMLLLLGYTFLSKVFFNNN